MPDDEHFIDIEDTPGYQTAFSQLAFAGKKEHDPIGEAVSNPKILLAQSLHKLSTACPGRVSRVQLLYLIPRGSLRSSPIRGNVQEWEIKSRVTLVVLQK